MKNVPNLAPDQVVYKGKPWKRKTLAAFLNLLVLPGTGSLVLGRVVAGWIQIGLCIVGFVIKIVALSSVTIWLRPVLQRLGAENMSQLKLEDVLAVANYAVAEFYQSAPPEIAGVNSLYLFWGGMLMILAGWVYGAVVLFLPDARRK